MRNQQTPRSPVADADMKYDIRIGAGAVNRSPGVITFVVTFAAGIAVGTLTTRRSSRR